MSDNNEFDTLLDDNLASAQKTYYGLLILKEKRNKQRNTLATIAEKDKYVPRCNYYRVKGKLCGNELDMKRVYWRHNTVFCDYCGSLSDLNDKKELDKSDKVDK
jgi:hypothetical protein